MAPVCNPQDTEQQQPQAKRQRRGRVVLDVGGGKFVASTSTLTSNSHNFAALLSGDWSDSGDEELYIDQDPAFKVLLDYMRSGMIRVTEVNEKVLLLAEFLGMERLVSAAKIRWLVNLGRGPSLADDCSDEEIVAAFDQQYGGISEAIGAGLFQYFLDMNDNAQEEFADIQIVDCPGGRKVVKAREFIDRDHPIETVCCPVAATNGLISKGYKIIKTVPNTLQLFSRRKHIHLRPRSESVFVPYYKDLKAKKKHSEVQYARFLHNHEGELLAVLAPPQFSYDERVRSNPFGVAVIQPVHECWGDMHGFQCQAASASAAKIEFDLHGVEGVNGDEVGTMKFVEREVKGILS